MKALLVPKEQAETFRKQLLEAGYMDVRRKLKVRGNDLEIPVTGIVPPEFAQFPGIRQENPEYYENEPAFRDLMKQYLGGDELDLLPRGW